jgi:Transposase
VLQEAELSVAADSENNLGGSSETMYFIGLDVHKKTISYCVKDAAGRVYQEGKIGSTRRELDSWIQTMPQPRTIAMEATIFTGWIYDHLLPHAEKIKVAHPLMLRAIAAAKKKNDRIDSGKIADCLRCDFLPECHMASTEIRDRRRTLRYRSLVIKQMVQMKNRVSGLLMETGVSYNKQRLHHLSRDRSGAYDGDLIGQLLEILRLRPSNGRHLSTALDLKQAHRVCCLNRLVPRGVLRYLCVIKHDTVAIGFDWRRGQTGVDDQLEYAIKSIRIENAQSSQRKADIQGLVDKERHQ